MVCVQSELHEKRSGKSASCHVFQKYAFCMSNVSCHWWTSRLVCFPLHLMRIWGAGPERIRSSLKTTWIHCNSGVHRAPQFAAGLMSNPPMIQADMQRLHSHVRCPKGLCGAKYQLHDMHWWRSRMDFCHAEMDLPRRSHSFWTILLCFFGGWGALDRSR